MSSPTENHVGRDGAVHALLPVVKARFETAARIGDLVRRHPRRELKNVPGRLAAFEQPALFSDAFTVPIAADRALHLFFQNAPGTAQFAQGVEVAEHGHVRIGRVVQVLVASRLRVRPLGRAHEREPGSAHQHLGIASGRDDAQIEPTGHVLHGPRAGKERIPPIRPRWRRHLRERSRKECLDLIVGLTHGSGRSHDLRTDGVRREMPLAERFNGRLVKADHRAERPGDQMQFVLDHQIGRRQRLAQRMARAWCGRAVKPAFVKPLRSPEQHARLPHPRQGGELVHSRYQERRQTPVERFVHRDNR